MVIRIHIQMRMTKLEQMSLINVVNNKISGRGFFFLETLTFVACVDLIVKHWAAMLSADIDYSINI